MTRPVDLRYDDLTTLAPTGRTHPNGRAELAGRNELFVHLTADEASFLAAEFLALACAIKSNERETA